MNEYVMQRLADDRSRQLRDEAARERSARQGRAAMRRGGAVLRSAPRAPERVPGVRGQIALLLGRSLGA